MGPTNVFKITAILPLLVASIALFINEEPIGKLNPNTKSDYTNGDESSNTGFMVEMKPATSNHNPASTITPNQSNLNNDGISPIDGVSNQIESLWEAIKEPAVWKPALFLFLWQSTPTSEGAFLYFMTNDLGFGPEFLGRVRLVTAVASLLGVWGYQKFLREVRQQIMKYCGVNLIIISTISTVHSQK